MSDAYQPSRRPRLGFLRWTLPVMALAASLALAYGAYRLADYSWNQVVDYQSPYTSLSGLDFSGARPDLADPIPDATARRVVVVLIDGLREDASRTMESVAMLRARGADVSLRVPQPSLSYPTWTTIMSGATPQISGVTTNWFEGPVAVETLLDVASGSGRSVVVAGTTDLDTMFRASEITTATSLVEWVDGEYMTGGIVDGALAEDAAAGGADFVFVLIPDVDEAGHNFGGASQEYADVVAKVDADLGRLIDGLDDGATTFFVLPDHGHIDTGGHGGWEKPVASTWAAIAGPGIKQATAEADLADIAPTVAVVGGFQAPLQSIGTAIDAVLADTNGRARDAEFIRAAGVTLSYVSKVLGDAAVTDIASIGSPSELPGIRAEADATRIAEERGDRLPVFLGILVAALVLIAFIGVTSWRALVSALAGAVTYSVVYNVLFFAVHGLKWSLSAFNDEEMIEAFFMQRMLEAALAGLAAALVAALVYAAMRRVSQDRPKGSAIEWLALGGAAVLLAQAVLLVQVGVFLWQWGAQIGWILPDFRVAFKYDLDLMQLTGLGAAAIAGPILAWLVGRLGIRRGQAAP